MSSKSTIQSLQQVVNLNIESIVEKLAQDDDKLLASYSLVNDLVDSMTVSASGRERIRQMAERVLEACMRKLQICLRDERVVIVPGMNLSLADWDTEQFTSLVGYLRLFAPHCSPAYRAILFQVYVIYFTRLMWIGKLEISRADFTHLMQTNGIEEFVFSSQTGLLDLKICNFLMTYLNAVCTGATMSHEMTEYLVKYSLATMLRLSDSPLVVKLCINNLTKLAAMSQSNRELVLTSVFTACLQSESSSNEQVESKKRLESFVQDLNLNILASLGDHIMQSTLESSSINYIHQTEFWSLIQAGLSHTNSLTRKQSLYLLKRAIDLAQVHKLTELNSQYFDSIHSSDQKVYLFQATCPIWNDFFLFLELLEETSVHVIKPVLFKLTTLLDAIRSYKLHFSWFLVLINRALLHESKFIVRWAVCSFLQFDFAELMSSMSHASIQNTVCKINGFILNQMMLALQTFYLYNKSDDAPFIDNVPKIALLLSKFLNNYLQALSLPGMRNEFVETFVSTLERFAWNGACLMFVCKSLFEIDPKYMPGVVNVKIVKSLIKMISCTLTTQEVCFRSATQTYLTQFLLKHIEGEQLDLDMLKSLIDLMSHLSPRECLVYQNSTWILIVNWLRVILQDKEKKNMIKSYIADEFDQLSNVNLDQFSIVNRSNKLAYLFLIVFDATEDQLVYQKPIQHLTNIVNPNSGSIETGLFVLNAMLDHILISKFSTPEPNSYQIVAGLHSTTSLDVVEYLIQRINGLDQSFQFESLLTYSTILRNVTKFKNQHDESSEKLKTYLAEHLLNQTISLFTESQEPNAEWRKFANLLHLSAILDCDVFNRDQFHQHQKFNLFFDQLTRFQTPSKSDLSKSKSKGVESMLENYSVMNGYYYQSVWKIIDFLLDEFTTRDNLHSFADSILNSYKNSIDLTSSHFLTSFIKSSRSFYKLVHFQPSLRETLKEIYVLVYKQIWQNKEDVRNFHQPYAQFLEIVMSPDALQHDQDGLFKSYIQHLASDLGERSNEKIGIMKPFVERFINMISNFDSAHNQHFVNVFISLLIHGDVYKKDRKPYKDIEYFIESLGGTFATNQLIKPEYLNDASVRIRTAYYLLKKESNLDQEFYSFLLDKMIERDRSITSTNQKFYINSQVHRERFRLWQTIISLMPKLTSVDFDKLAILCEECLVTENQPSIRLLMEWILIKIFSSRPHEQWQELWSKQDNFTTKKVGYTCSWISILTNLAPIVESDAKKIEYVERLLPVIMSQILSTNFHIRTYIEATLIKLYFMFQETGSILSHLSNEPRIQLVLKQVYSVIQPILSDKERHSNILSTHFYFRFDPQLDFSIETVFFYFPYLSCLMDEDTLSKECVVSIILDKCLYELTEADFDLVDSRLSLKLRNKATKLVDCSPGVWRFTAFRDESLFEPNVSVEDLQKKIIPWHLLMPDQEDLNNLNRKKAPANASSSLKGLSLVCSLVDKTTNLGGIARTSEIFNVRELVVNTVRCLEDKTFQSLAVTSEKWLNIKEVPVKHLKTFLMEAKCNGYALVGLEQTANSVRLDEFKFPANSILVLGNEKEGIPVELIQMLDYCVEIPQLGVIRSLNVHVSASIAVWEYAKQHLI